MDTLKLECGDKVRVINGNHCDRHLCGTEGILVKRYGAGKAVAQLLLINPYGRNDGHVNVDFKNIELIQKRDTGTEVTDEEVYEEEDVRW